MRACFLLLSIISWMCLVVTAMLKGAISVEMGVMALIAGIFVFAMGGRRIMRQIMPIAGLLLLLYTLTSGSIAEFGESVEAVSVLAIMCIGFFVMFRGLRGTRT